MDARAPSPYPRLTSKDGLVLDISAVILGKVIVMAVEDWLRAARAEEQRLLGEIMKTDFYKQLEAVRGVLDAYQGKRPTPPITAVAERGSKANILNVA
jgi:hypothetical protein